MQNHVSIFRLSLHLTKINSIATGDFDSWMAHITYCSIVTKGSLLKRRNIGVIVIHIRMQNRSSLKDDNQLCSININNSFMKIV